MATEKRQPQTPVKDRLFEEWYNYSFFQAVYLLESFSPEKKKIGQSLEPQKEAVRFTVKPSFTFSPSDISGLQKAASPEDPAVMDIAFLGLIGPSGVLPHCYNDLAIERVRHKDNSLVDFLNLFHHRLISLFYLAWKKHQFPVNFLPGAKDNLSKYLLSLCGLGTKGLTGKIGFAEESLSYYSGLLSRNIPSGETIRSTVEHFSGTDTEIEEFVQRLIPLDREDQTQLGKTNCKAGVDTFCGTHVWDCQTKFLLNLGPMHFKQFVRFFPSSDMHGPTFSLVRYMVGIEYEFDIKIILHREEVPPCILGKTGIDAPRLGWSTWLKSKNIHLSEDPFITFFEA